MPVTIKVNGTVNSLVHKGSTGFSAATIPDVCKTPTPAGPTPMPYPNIAQSSMLAKGTTTVKADGMMAAVKGSEFSISSGDEAGTVGGVKSNTFIKEATWLLYSFDVKLEGKNACRLSDKMFHNHENTASLMGETQNPVSVGGAGGGTSAKSSKGKGKGKGKKKKRKKRKKDPCDSKGKGNPRKKYKGGKHGHMKKGGSKRTPPTESHHMPSDSASRIRRNNGPAIQMSVADHKRTASWGSSNAAKAHRAKQARLIAQGKLKQAMQMDIKDIRKKFGNKYDSAIEQMLAYAKCKGYV